jgi:peroxiredoxin
MSTFPIAAAPHSPLPSRRYGQRLFFLLVLLWALMFGLSWGVATHADEPAASPEPRQTSAVALVTSPSTHARLKRPAPELQVSAWVDQSGPVTPPSREGKVQLVVFWGVNCPACVQKIPQVRKAATRCAGTDLVVIGLHNAQISPDRVVRFARDRELNYPIAIDRSGKNRYSFGATSAAYDVQAIPHAAVIDRDGSLKYVGDFDDALKAAEQLLKGVAS